MYQSEKKYYRTLKRLWGRLLGSKIFKKYLANFFNQAYFNEYLDNKIKVSFNLEHPIKSTSNLKFLQACHNGLGLVVLRNFGHVTLEKLAQCAIFAAHRRFKPFWIIRKIRREFRLKSLIEFLTFYMKNWILYIFKELSWQNIWIKPYSILFYPKHNNWIKIKIFHWWKF